MPVTITLTDDQALEIVAQIGTMLKSGGKLTASADKSPYVLVAEHIATLKSGENVHFGHLLQITGLDSNALSRSLIKLRGEKKVKMVRRGTWEKV